MDLDDRDTANFVRAVEARFKALGAAHNQLANAAAQRWQQEDNVRRMQTYQQQRELVREIHERGQAYISFILTVGYAGFFGLWAIAKDYRWPRLQALSLVLIALSLMVFVGWELLQTVVRSTDPEEPTLVGEEPKKRLLGPERLRKAWPWFFVTSTFTGLAAGGLLMWVLIAQAWGAFSEPQPATMQPLASSPSIAASGSLPAPAAGGSAAIRQQPVSRPTSAPQ